MFKFILKKILGSKNERDLKKIRPLVDRINEIEESLQKESDDFLREKTAKWKEELSKITDNDELARRLDEILPEAFAVVKNGARRLCGTMADVRGHELEWQMVHFDVQLIGGIGLHQGRIAEMATGEGKTLVGTLPVYLNALSGRGVHVVTVNDYLAARDAEWMGHLFRFLGLTIGCIQNMQPPPQRREMYECDITYGTNSEFGFDYLRDNGMAIRQEHQVQRGHYFAIVDEVDSILIDEARTPLIISGPATQKQDNRLYDVYRPKVEGLIRMQQKLCERFLQECRQDITKLEEEQQKEKPNKELVDNLKYSIGILLYRVRMGSPKSPKFLQMLEDPAHISMLNAAENQLHLDQSKKELYAQKEELFFAIEEKSHDADLTEKGRGFMNPNDADAFVLPDLSTEYHEIDNDPEADVQQRMERKQELQGRFEAKSEEIHVISQLVKAYCLYEKDVQYVIEEGKVVIVDENTGRPMYGRRWSEGLHQAVEAKEGVSIEDETQTLATITIQNYFRLYTKLAGMTGTAETEAQEFYDIYKLGLLVIPTNQKVAREDYNDTVYKTGREKFHAIVNEIKEIHQQGRPILVGTKTVEVSEYLSKLLKRESIIHAVLNAKHHEQEAEIVSRAGQKGAVTIATNMAGRGTDIKLGAGVKEAGGLHVLGTERHDSRRVDRQLRGRCSRQGDPGSSHFFISLEDDLMRLFGSDRIGRIMERVGLEENQELEHPLLNRSIETAQKRIEQQHFQVRKRTLEFDDVMNKQREIVYGFRSEVIGSEDLREMVLDLFDEIVVAKVEEFLPAQLEKQGEGEGRDTRGLADWVNYNFPVGISEEEIEEVANEAKAPAGEITETFEGLQPSQLAVASAISENISDAYTLKGQIEDPEALAAIERYAILQAIDSLWQEHLYSMDAMRKSIGLRAYGQKDPLQEYKTEAFNSFGELMNNIKTEICHNIFRTASSPEAFESFLKAVPNRMNRVKTVSAASEAAAPAAKEKPTSDIVEQASAAAVQRKATKVATAGRNDPCPCGSGKKYKKCCGRNG